MHEIGFGTCCARLRDEWLAENLCGYVVAAARPWSGSTSKTFHLSIQSTLLVISSVLAYVSRPLILIDQYVTGS